MIFAIVFIAIVFVVGFAARTPVKPITEEQLRAETSL